MRAIGDFTPVELYREFADNQTAESPCFHAWAQGVADDDEVLARIATLPGLKRQPNLVFTAARWHGAAIGPYDGLRQVLLERWPDVEATVLSRATQTNEVGRCATLLPVLASLPGPLALLEVGCSAGLCLLPDRYSYRYTGSRGSVAIDPVDGPSPVVIECRLEGDVPLLGRLPEVVWRGGLDLNPLDVHDDDAMRWLQMLVWPEHEDRLVGQVPPEATLVVFHSAVMVYLSASDRARFSETMSSVRGHWVCNEGSEVMTMAPPSPLPPTSAVAPASFVLALDGSPVAWTHGHGRALRWL